MAVGPAILNWTVQDFILFSKLTAKRSSDGNFARAHDRSEAEGYTRP